VFGGAALAVGAAAAYRRYQAANQPTVAEGDLGDLGWGNLGEPERLSVPTPDGAQLAVWDVGAADAPVVVLPHCWGCSHAIWVPVARRLLEAGHRVVLYDQRGHGASTRGTALLSIASLADDLTIVLEARDVNGAVLAGHSMGGMTIMSLATHRPEVLRARARALVLVATAAGDQGLKLPQAERMAASFIASILVTRALRSANGHRFVRNVFGDNPERAHMELTRELFADCDGAVRGGFLAAMHSMDLRAGIGGIEMPTTVMVGSRDRLTPPARAHQIVASVPGARLITLEGRGHMLPLEDPDAVADEIIRAVKG